MPILGPWPAGMNSVLPDNVEPTETTPIPLRSAVNVDITDEGKVRTREGYTKVMPAILAHSLFALPDGGLCVLDGDLVRFDRSMQYTTLLAGVGGSTMNYTGVAGAIYLTNGLVTAMYKAGVLTSWGVETPSTSPTIMLTAGVMPAGDYMVTCTFVRDTGEESGSNLPVVVRSVPDGSGFILTNLPMPSAADVTFVNVYVSTAGGAELYLALHIPVGAIGELLTGAEPFGARLQTALLSPMPRGVGAATSRGRVFTVSGNALWYSEPLRYGLCDASANYILFPTDIQLVVGLATGLFIAADKTYFWGGPDSPDPLRVVGEYTGVRNSVSYMPSTSDAIWLSSRGMARGTLDGQVTLLTDGRLATKYAGHGSTIYRESAGIKQFIGTATETSPTALTARGYMDATITRAK